MKRRISILVLLLILLFVYSKIKMNQDNPEVLVPLLAKVENYIPHRDEINPEVSKADVAWQLDHILKTINRVTEVLEKSNPDAFKSSISGARIMSLTAGYIPRGRAQSPDVVKPPEVIVAKAIYRQLEEAKVNIAKLKELDENSNFEHFVFGQLNKAQTIRFMEVHTKHHLKIVDDILNN
ncbi:DinB family protein [Winogradskyella luteola]|uniref:DinB family protein n=1 Tax=Winogradskyella luteola TaxID=2828330 RepID=A0A9X1F7P8_9FLAO|nr:DinB family protein [Winogradskyella luteola]MBV7268875.1 DinB family protein [Winogradskyella luteola]